MKIIRTAMVFLFMVTNLYAQKGKVTVALNFKDTGKLDKAVEVIEAAVDTNNPKAESSVNWPRTWEVRGEIYQAIFQSKDGNYKNLHNNPLPEALSSYLKALELDVKKRFLNSIKIKMHLLINDFLVQAEAAFNEQNFDKALASFEQVLAIEANPVLFTETNSTVDTVIIFNAGLSAYNAKKYDKAIGYYKKAASYKYNGARTYELLLDSYFCKNDTVGALEIMHKGLIEYPDNPFILSQLITFYEKRNKVEDALKYLDIAISKDPGNEAFHLYRGILFERLQNNDEAVKSYQKAIDLKPDYMDAYLNLGLVYYNRGVIQVNTANLVPANQPEKYEEEKKKADTEFSKALPYLEKAHTLNASDRTALESLKNMYYRLQMLDKHTDIVEKLKNVQ